MTAVRTTQFKDSDPSWDGPAFTTIGDLPGLLRQRYSIPQSGSAAASMRH